LIAIVDYGVGNVEALANIFKQLGLPCLKARTAVELVNASHVILPGVGAFDWAMSRLDASGMRPSLDEIASTCKKPILGICVGMQMMARRSDEGSLAGLGWFDAHVRRFDESRLPPGSSLPHMGWNDIDPIRADSLMQDVGEHARFYFLHSYFFSPREEQDILATTMYGFAFPCAVQRGCIYGVQFHPEKSHAWGVKLLKNFASL
jgi:glutamine amidotransferase